MKKLFTLAALVFCIGKLMAQSQDPPSFWEDELKNEYNREPMHSTYFAYENKALALKNDPAKSTYFQSLNGEYPNHDRLWRSLQFLLRSLQIVFHRKGPYQLRQLYGVSI